MKCVECVDYVECSKKHNLTIKRKHCPLTKVEYVQTNADRIRAMSDEEFSCFLALVENRKTGKTSFDDTSDFWLEYLKQPAEE